MSGIKDTNLPAILGGTPVRDKKIFYGRQWINEDDVKAVAGTLTADLITCGPQVDALEKRLTEYTGAKFAIACSNGTTALHLAAAAAGIGSACGGNADDEVITTPITFMASANCALYCGAVPVFADINPETYNIDPASVREKITDKTKAVVAVDYTGQCCEFDELRKICDEHGLVLIEDAAHSIGSKYNGKPVGSIADMTCFSFHPVKTVTGGEGGAVLTDDPELARKLRLLRSHSMEHDQSLFLYPGYGNYERTVTDENGRSVTETVDDMGGWYYEQQMLGFNYRMTDFQAALLISQLGRIDFFVARRKEIVARYNEAFADLDGVIVQKEIPESDTCRHLYVLRLDPEKLSCTRKEFFNAMSAENVQCQVHYIPVYWMPEYVRRGYRKGLCPKAEEVYRNIMSIPLYPMMSDQDVCDVIAAVKKLVAYYHK